MLITKEVEIKLCNYIKHYESRGYIFNKTMDNYSRSCISKNDIVLIKTEDLLTNSHVKILIACDSCGFIFEKTWQEYNRFFKDKTSHYCNLCKSVCVKRKVQKRIRGMSFKQWCIINQKSDLIDRWDYALNKEDPDNISYGSINKYYFKCHIKNHKSRLVALKEIVTHSNRVECIECNSFKTWCINNDRQDLLKRWDYDLNTCMPDEIRRGSNKKCWFKCLCNSNHKSVGVKLTTITNIKKPDKVKCKECNSIAQYIVNLEQDENALDKYWDWDKNILNPWKVQRGSRTKVWIKCINNKNHASYPISCCSFTADGCRCPYCWNSHGKVYHEDSLGFTTPQVLKIWSDKNSKTAYEYTPNGRSIVWWKCDKGVHSDYKRKISDSRSCEFRCPICQYSKGEDKIYSFLTSYDIKYVAQKEFGNLTGTNGGNLSYDFYLPNYNLLIEYQGGQHEKYIKGFHSSEKDFEKQQEHDRRKKQYAEKHNIKLLEIWYWDFDNIEEILKKELNL